MTFRISLLKSTSYIFLLYRSPFSHYCCVLSSIFDSIDMVLSRYLFANRIVFTDCSAHHISRINHSGIHIARIQTLNVTLIQFLTQLVDIPTHFSSMTESLLYLISSLPLSPTNVMLCISLLLLIPIMRWCL